MDPLPFELTTEQAQVLKLLQQQRLVAVAGCAGSGKTTLATELARWMDGQGQNVLLLCRNPYLAEEFAQRLKPSRVSMHAFTGFIQELLQGSPAPDVFVRPTRPRWTAGWSAYEAPTQADLNRAVDILNHISPRYQAVIIDEGQDFQESWLEVADACLDDPERGRLVVFYDDNPRLAPFGPQRTYVTFQLPVTLNRNCRSAGQVEALVRQLHPGNLLPGLRAGESGAFREWLYSNEAELLDSLRLALHAGEELSPRLENVVVISAESSPVRMSKFAGLVFDSPRLRAAPSPGRLKWQAAVLRYLQGFGLLERQLSQAPQPAPADIKNVNKFCAAYLAAHRPALSRQPGYLSQSNLGWAMDAYGELHLRWQDGIHRDLPPIDLLRFFGNPGWAAALPPAHKRYRLTPAEELAHQPDVYPVRLADISSFKGLEADGVIFVLYNYFAENDDQLLASLYEVFSRARRWLYVITPSDGSGEIRQAAGY
jgi:energy-coupling factor transporter ATP-binding protein EcfA2